MCRNDEVELGRSPSRLTEEEWESFKRRVSGRVQDARGQAFRALFNSILTAPHLLARGGWRTLRGLTTNMVERANTWRRLYLEQRALRMAIHDLHALDDRMLRDIGLGRSEIESAVRDPQRVMARELVRYAVRTGGGSWPKLVDKPAPRPLIDRDAA
jgi:uncharacterized protein YjiS (DUF1127 family)